MDLTMHPNVKTTKGKGVKALPGLQHFGGRRACYSFRMGIRKIDKQFNYLHGPAQTKPQVG